ncbi:hypothetical protein [uncultured Helicobacter sp.]|uniref:AbiTii domain-containing protein n=1 Tax=uncultured Helicobacter sp. TaxID=175537 RepID=UPI00260BDF5E|nr:hypothetical protein [uncultured Helicobacter sp.]
MPKSKIIKELVNDEISLEKALHRVIVLAKDLKDFKLEQWAKNEIRGYSNPEEIPEYRRVNFIFIGSYIGGGLKYNDAPLPMEFLKQLSPEEQKNITTYKMKESLGFLKLSIEKNEKLGRPVTPENMQLFSVGTNTEILLARGEINLPEIIAIVNEVKTRVLDILCELEDKFGCLDDMDISNGSDTIKEEARQKINQIIICDTYNNMEIGDGNTIKKSNFLSKLFKK